MSAFTSFDGDLNITHEKIPHIRISAQTLRVPLQARDNLVREREVKSWQQ